MFFSKLNIRLCLLHYDSHRIHINDFCRSVILIISRDTDIDCILAGICYFRHILAPLTAVHPVLNSISSLKPSDRKHCSMALPVVYACVQICRQALNVSLFDNGSIRLCKAFIIFISVHIDSNRIFARIFNPRNLPLFFTVIQAVCYSVSRLNASGDLDRRLHSSIIYTVQRLRFQSNRSFFYLRLYCFHIIVIAVSLNPYLHRIGSRFTDLRHCLRPVSFSEPVRHPVSLLYSVDNNSVMKTTVISYACRCGCYPRNPYALQRDREILI